MDTSTNYIPTPFVEGDQRLLYARVSGVQVGRWEGGRRLRPRKVNFWRFFHQEGDEEPKGVGPEYTTQRALLADMDRYALDFGFTCPVMVRHNNRTVEGTMLAMGPEPYERVVDTVAFGQIVVHTYNLTIVQLTIHKHSVSDETREEGLRQALGQDSGAVQQMRVLRQAAC